MVSNIIGNFEGLVEPGDHLVLLYNEETRPEKAVTSYISNSLSNNERCIYITGDANNELVFDALRKKDLFDSYLDSGQLVILNQDEAYSKNGKFVPDKMISLIINLTKNAITDGYNGLAISGEISSVLDYEEGIDLIYEYEWKLNDLVFDHYPTSALCRYNMTKFTDDMIVDIIQLHPYLCLENIVHENPFYLPPNAYKENNIKKYQVETWLENIVNYTNTKSNFTIRLEKIEKKYDTLQANLIKEIIMSLTGLLEIHDKYTKNHSENVAKLSRKLADAIGLPQSLKTIIYYTGIIHDIGKTIIPKEILLKKGSLTKEEFNQIKLHPKWGSNALNKSEELEEVSTFILHHHERWDGKGYPDNLKGNTIPIASRIIAICDAYDAMIHDRSYRKALSHQEAINEIINNAGRQFDPKLAKVFVENVLGKSELDKINLGKSSI